MTLCQSGAPRHKMLVSQLTSGRQNNGPLRCPHPVSQLPDVANEVLQKLLNLQTPTSGDYPELSRHAQSGHMTSWK